MKDADKLDKTTADEGRDPFSQVPHGRREAKAYLKKRPRKFAILYVAHAVTDSTTVIQKMIATKRMTEQDGAFMFMCAEYFGGAVNKGEHRCAAGTVLRLSERLRACGCTDEETFTVVQTFAAIAAAFQLAEDLHLLGHIKKWGEAEERKGVLHTDGAPA